MVYKNKQGRCKVNLWACISKDGLGELYWVSNKFNSEKYCEMLDDALVKMNAINPNFVLLQDNARHHTSKYTKSYLANSQLKYYDRSKKRWITVPKNSLNRAIKLVKRYPARSPDLNIIENVWSILQYKYDQMVMKYGHPRNAVRIRQRMLGRDEER